VIALLLVHKPERLAGADARFQRKWLGWSGQDTAERLSFTPKTASRWENDKVPISETADKLLQNLVRIREPIEDYATWDSELSTLAKSAPTPFPLMIVKDGPTWSRAA
jgi:transcriptional regulator with XRE-family HTH domain